MPALPMLAESYRKYRRKVGWESAWAQPRLTGLRCLATLDGGKVTLTGPDGKPLAGFSGVRDALKGSGLCNLVLDGVLCHPGASAEVVRAARWDRGRPRFHVVDLVDDLGFAKRIDGARAVVEGLDSPHLTLARTVKVQGEADLMVCAQAFVADGHPGAIVRYGSAGYVVGRSPALLKVDTCLVGAYVVVDYKLQAGGVVFTCETPGGAYFDVLGPGSPADRAALATVADKCLGRKLNVQYYPTGKDRSVSLPAAVGFVDFDPTAVSPPKRRAGRA